MPRLALIAILSVLAAGLLASCGAGETQPAALAPANPLVYAEVELKPEGDQKAALDALARKFPGSGSAGQRLSSLIEDGLREEDSKISFENDVKPWLGDRAAFYAAAPPRGGSSSGLSGAGDTPAAALVATTDEQKALETVQKEQGKGSEREYQGVTYQRFDDDEVAATIDGYLVLGNEPGLKAIVNASENDRRLQDSDRFKQALEGQPKDRLGFVYADLRGVFDAIPSSQAQFLAPFRRAFREPVVATATAETDALEITSKTPKSNLSALGLAGIGSAGTDLIGDLPGDSLFATGGPALGRQLSGAADLAASSVGGRAILEQGLRQRTGLDLQEDILGWMGDYGLFVRGQSQSNLGGALVVESTDPAATRRAIDGFQRILRSQAGTDARVGKLGIRGAEDGFTVTADDLPRPLHVFLASDRFVIAFGDEAANEVIDPSGGTLKDESTFTQATQGLGAGYTVNTYASVPAALLLAEGMGATSDSDYQRAKPYLEPLGALVGGAKPAGDQLESKFRLTVPGG